MTSPWVRRREESTLALLVSALVGGRVRLELRNETSVIGTLESADEHMNMRLADATVLRLELQDGPPVRAGHVSVRGRQVRYVHLPGDMDVAAELDAQDERRRAARSAYRRRAKRD